MGISLFLASDLQEGLLRILAQTQGLLATLGSLPPSPVSHGPETSSACTGLQHIQEPILELLPRLAVHL